MTSFGLCKVFHHKYNTTGHNFTGHYYVLQTHLSLSVIASLDILSCFARPFMWQFVTWQNTYPCFNNKNPQRNKLYLVYLHVYIVLRRKTHISGVMVRVFASNTVDRRFETRSSSTQGYKIGICCFSGKHSTLRRKSKDWLSRNQNNMSECVDMSSRGLLSQWSSTIKIQLSVLV